MQARAQFSRVQDDKMLLNRLPKSLEKSIENWTHFLMHFWSILVSKMAPKWLKNQPKIIKKIIQKSDRKLSPKMRPSRNLWVHRTGSAVSWIVLGSAVIHVGSLGSSINSISLQWFGLLCRGPRLRSRKRECGGIRWGSLGFARICWNLVGFAGIHTKNAIPPEDMASFTEDPGLPPGLGFLWIS